ncbi:FecR family protein [Chitinophaga barathri]|uniref:FecR family protein n=1 Tax=Chitinophaga barathri TaxID=1647451 RepID=A0A3N4MVW2_9BACT|nr:FecR family protein [Chitinophaga barathri]RPD39533.1 FecR family protein [Chitinophaga barathri]
MDTQEHIAQLLKKYADGNCAPEEIAIVEQWYASLQLQPPPGDTVRPQQGDRLWEKIAARTGSPVKARRPIRRYIGWAAAAAAVFLFAAAILWFNRPADDTGHRQFTAAAGKIIPLSLPDGSRVWLSSGASLRFEPGFADGRHVLLEQGEAFFDIRQDDRHPFTVEARGTRTRVLGTSFRVNAGLPDEAVEVTVITGKVQVEGNSQPPVVLTRQESAAFKPLGTAPAVKQADTLVATPQSALAREGWQARSLDLDNVSTGELVLLLESIYNVRFSFAEERLKTCMNTISINTGRPLPEILDKLKLINHFEYKVTPEGILIYGAGCGSI